MLFDFDGTLADSFGIVLEAFEKLVPQKSKLTKQQIQELKNKSYAELLSYFGISIFKVPSLVIKGRHMLKKSIDRVEPFNGMQEVLKALKQAGYHLVILSSNSPQNIQRFLKKHHLDTYFDSVHGDIGLLGKPKIIRSIKKKVGCDAEQVAYIGDEPRDIDAARRVGVHSIAVTWGFTGEKILRSHHPERVVRTPDDLPQAIGSL